MHEDREKLALWMMEHGYATGHGDTIDDLLSELEWQINEQTQERVTPMADVTYEDHIVKALQDWKADSDRHFPWVGGKPQRVLSIPLSAILLDQSNDRAYVTADDLITAFGRTE